LTKALIVTSLICLAERFQPGLYLWELKRIQLACQPKASSALTKLRKLLLRFHWKGSVEEVWATKSRKADLSLSFTTPTIKLIKTLWSSISRSQYKLLK